MAVTWAMVRAGIQLATRALAPLRKIPGVDLAYRSFKQTFLSPVSIKLVSDTEDPDLDTALELYKERIPDDQRFEAADIVSWLREDRESRRHAVGTAPTDWFLVAVYKQRVCGFVLFHYYPLTRLALFAYMVVVNTPGIPADLVGSRLSGFTANLLKSRRELRGYRGILFEVEDPRRESNNKRRREALARVRRFCVLAEVRGLSLRALDFPYKQPKLSTEDPPGSERPLLLLYARSKDRAAPIDAQARRSEAAELLCFIYTRVYPEGYSSDTQETEAYLQYCRDLKDREIAALPNDVRSLSIKQLVAQIRTLHRGT